MQPVKWISLLGKGKKMKEKKLLGTDKKLLEKGGRTRENAQVTNMKRRDTC